MHRTLKDIMNRFFLFYILLLLPLAANGFIQYIDQAAVYVDSTHKRSMVDILAKGNSPNTWQLSSLSPGYTTDAIWVKLPLKPYLQPQKQLTVFTSHPLIESIAFFVVDDGDILSQKKMGTSISKQQRHYPIPYFAIDLPANLSPKATLYVKLYNGNSSLKTRLVVADTKAFWKKVLWSIIFFAIFLGVALFQFIYSLVQLYIHQSRAHLWYASFIFWAIVHQAFNTGFAHLIWPDNILAVAEYIRIVASPFVVLSLSNFAYHLLDVRQLFGNWVSKLFKGFALFYLIAAVLVFLPLPFMPYRYGILLVFYIVLLTNIVAVAISAIVAARKGHLPAYYYLLAQIPIGLFLITTILLNIGVLPYNMLYHYLAMGAVMFEIVLSLVVLTVYFNRLQVARLKTANLGNTALNNTMVGANVLAEPKMNQDAELYQDLIFYFEQEKPFLHANLRIADVAEKMQTTVHELSRIINRHGSMHFFDFVNSYRIQQAKKLLASKAHTQKFTLERTAEQCGFNNRSSFHQAFKKFTTVTPSAFKKQAQKG